MTRTTHLVWLLGIVCLSGCADSAADTAQVPHTPPNLVLIVSDFMGYADTGPYGAQDIATPSLDRLAAEGMRFTDFHAAGSTCGPSRASLHTGLYPARAGIEVNVVEGEAGLLPNRTTLSTRLRDSGYETALIGKWHLGQGKSGPRAHGFGTFFGFHTWTLDYYEHTTPSDAPGLWQNERRVKREGYLTDILSDEAVDFVRAPHDKPFFLFLGYNTALTPHQPPGLAPGDRDGRWENVSRADYAAMIESMDTGIGRVLAALDEQGLSDETVVVFTTDHGGGELANAEPHYEGFRSLWEGGVRVPLIVRWPQVIAAGGVSGQVGISMDLTATLLDASGVSVPTERFDGVSLLPILAGEVPEHERTVFWRQPAGEFAEEGDPNTTALWACRRGRWKYIESVELSDAPRGQLFDLDVDPAETTDLADREPALCAELGAALRAWNASLPTPL